MNTQIFNKCISSLNHGKSSKIILTECYQQRVSEFLKLRNAAEDDMQNLVERVCESKNIDLILYLMGVLPQEVDNSQSFIIGMFGGKKNDD